MHQYVCTRAEPDEGPPTPSEPEERDADPSEPEEDVPTAFEAEEGPASPQKPASPQGSESPARQSDVPAAAPSSSSCSGIAALFEEFKAQQLAEQQRARKSDGKSGSPPLDKDDDIDKDVDIGKDDDVDEEKDDFCPDAESVD